MTRWIETFIIVACMLAALAAIATLLKTDRIDSKLGAVPAKIDLNAPAPLTLGQRPMWHFSSPITRQSNGEIVTVTYDSPAPEDFIVAWRKFLDACDTVRVS